MKNAILHYIFENQDFADIIYKGHTIGFNYYGENEYTIQINGDDLFFITLSDAKNYIDKLTK